MRISIKVEDLRPGQFQWLLRNLPRGRHFDPQQTRMCVEFVGPGGAMVEHVELGVVEFMHAVGELKYLSHRVEAALTPDVLFEVARRRHAGHGEPCEWCGGPCNLQR